VVSHAAIRQKSKACQSNARRVHQVKRRYKPICAHVRQKWVNDAAGSEGELKVFFRLKSGIRLLGEIVIAEKSLLFAEEQMRRTNRGDLVRSKSEATIANKLHAREIDYEGTSRTSRGRPTKAYPSGSEDPARFSASEPCPRLSFTAKRLTRPFLCLG